MIRPRGDRRIQSHGTNDECRKWGRYYPKRSSHPCSMKGAGGGTWARKNARFEKLSPADHAFKGRGKIGGTRRRMTASAKMWHEDTTIRRPEAGEGVTVLWIFKVDGGASEAGKPEEKNIRGGKIYQA